MGGLVGRDFASPGKCDSPKVRAGATERRPKVQIGPGQDHYYHSMFEIRLTNTLCIMRYFLFVKRLLFSTVENIFHPQPLWTKKNTEVGPVAFLIK